LLPLSGIFDQFDGTRQLSIFAWVRVSWVNARCRRFGVFVGRLLLFRRFFGFGFKLGFFLFYLSAFFVA